MDAKGSVVQRVAKCMRMCDVFIYVILYIPFSDYCNFRALRGFISGEIS